MAVADTVVVMDHRPYRAGRPRRARIYNAPATRFVARFIGGHNVLEGEPAPGVGGRVSG